MTSHKGLVRYDKSLIVRKPGLGGVHTNDHVLEHAKKLVSVKLALSGLILLP